MSEMKCFGYYLVEPLKKPDWCTLKADKILSVSENGLSCKHPVLSKCFWTNTPESGRKEYAQLLGLDREGFSLFSELINELFGNGRLTPYVRFSRFEDAVNVGCYLRNIPSLKLVGLFTDDENFANAEKTAAAVNKKSGGKLIGCEILGSHMSEHGYFSFDSYIINSLNEVLEEKTDIRIDRDTGLILDPYEEARRFSAIIQGMGEPVIWSPFEIYEYESISHKSLL